MNRHLAIVTFLGLTAFGAAAGAQDRSSPVASPSPLTPLYACADMTDPAQRLACFDAAVAAVRAAENTSQIVTFDKQRIETVRREAFGFRMPSLPRIGMPSFGGRGTDAGSPGGANSRSGSTAPAMAVAEEIEEQSFAVARVTASAGRAVLVLDNGQVWRLVDTDEINAPRQTPFNVRIRTAAMGSFILTIEGRNKGYRVRRVE